MNDALSHTSNTAKLLKHILTLKDLQQGIVKPIMVHVMPTHRCQLKCAHCCFRNRTDVQMDMDPDLFMEGIKQFYQLGTRAMEFTGGGEPTLYPHIQTCLKYFIETLDMKIGLITNGLSIGSIAGFVKYLRWVRVSLNPIDYGHAANLHPAVEFMREKTHVSFCYIWNKHSPKKIEEVAQFSDTYGIVCRVAPDCIQPLKDIETEMEVIRGHLDRIQSSTLFLSDFNTTLSRRNSNCYIHLIKPAFYTDGYVYPCPSAELALEHDKKIDESARLCHGSDIYRFYTAVDFPIKLLHDCSYCKYSKQQDLLEDLLTETDFNDFA